MGFLKPKTQYIPMPETPAAPAPPPVLTPASGKPTRRSSSPSFLGAGINPGYGTAFDTASLMADSNKGKTLLGQ